MHQLALALRARGHAIDVITSFPHYEHFRVRDEFRGKWHERKHEDGLDVTRLAVFANGKKDNMKFRLLSYLSFNALATATNLLRRERYDVILCTNGGFFSGVSAFVSGAPKGTPFVYNIQDLYPETFVAQGRLTNRHAIAWLGRIERFMYRTARHITVVAPSFRTNLIEQKQVPPGKVSVIPNFVDTNLIRPLPKRNPFSEKFDLADKFVVTHAGNLGYVYDLDSLLEAAAELRAEKEIVFLIVGTGVARPALEAKARTLQLDNVRFLDFQPVEMLPYLRAASDVQVSLYRQHAARYSMPSKIYEIMASGRALLASADAGSDVWNLVAESGCGICVAPEDKTALAEAIFALYRDPAARAAMGQRGRAYAEQHYSKPVVVAQYEALLLAIIARHTQATGYVTN